uniref:Uncharacterized protein n=1 Tax=Sexangularia sp. CB-2014 TaxID=1486929 RepID=A0A7S1YGE9_9EUKA|mmetsp:Transcript_459/g.1390  ORF Transcript_459/g.1390 Transcript_459/m.1390 type:complete len:160 (+) Transcript_459:70-549(+)
MSLFELTKPSSSQPPLPSNLSPSDLTTSYQSLLKLAQMNQQIVQEIQRRRQATTVQATPADDGPFPLLTNRDAAVVLATNRDAMVRLGRLCAHAASQHGWPDDLPPPPTVASLPPIDAPTYIASLTSSSPSFRDNVELLSSSLPPSAQPHTGGPATVAV